ncbi:hypothetical protein [Leptothoe spongobia]|uniref:Uncharacterized protein n=1 Tax=Leptothoe spongobia TAU-MAC 1115 TaxID=1967444 RepID=A0A947GIL2_9CYAN|nr:hypothetical protein [Leptothoe spongobia]MBT9316315.1 hypothetical protein [Leptothoe spongobia TAU-MAC 1115]
MTSNPQSQLFQLLAQANEQRKTTDRIGEEARNQSSVTQSSLLPDIDSLRTQIESAGVGANPELEDDYLETLRTFRRLGQVAQSGSSKVTTSVSTELAKTLRIVDLYQSVYGQGALRKSTGGNVLIGMLYAHGASDEHLRGVS